MLTIECKIQCSVHCTVGSTVHSIVCKKVYTRNIGSVPEKKWPTTFKSLFNLKHGVHLHYNTQNSVKKGFFPKQSRVKCSIQYLVVYCTAMCPATYVLETRGNWRSLQCSKTLKDNCPQRVFLQGLGQLSQPQK